MLRQSVYLTTLFLGRTFFSQKLTSALLESVEGRGWLQKIYHNQSPRKNVAGRDWTDKLLITNWMHSWLRHWSRHFASTVKHVMKTCTSLHNWTAASIYLHIVSIAADCTWQSKKRRLVVYTFSFLLGDPVSFPTGRLKYFIMQQLQQKHTKTCCEKINFVKIRTRLLQDHFTRRCTRYHHFDALHAG